jgi:hypothetical protein
LRENQLTTPLASVTLQNNRFSAGEKARIKALMPDTKIYF